MGTDFVNIIADAGGDYTSFSACVATQSIDFTSARGRVYSHNGISGTVADSASCSGSVGGYTCAVKHCTPTQVLVYHGAADQTFTNGETVSCAAGLFVINSTIGAGAGDTANLVMEVDGELNQSTYYSMASASLSSGENNRIKIRSKGAAKRSKSNALGYGSGVGRVKLSGYTGTSDILRISENYVDVEDLDFITTDSTHTGYCINIMGQATASMEINLRRLVVANKSTAAGGCITIATSADGPVVIDNCVCYSDGSYVLRIAGDNVAINYGTFISQFVGNAYGVYVTAGSTTITNCYAARAGTFAAYSYGAYATLDHCAANDTTGTEAGFDNLAVSTSEGCYFTNVTAGSEDFRIKTDSALKDVATAIALTTDIFGTNRPNGSEDVGAHEFSSSGITASGAPTWGNYSSRSDNLTCPTLLFADSADASLGTATPSDVVSLLPHFSAYVWKNAGAAITDVYVQVSSAEDSGWTSSPAWDSGWLALTSQLANSSRIEDIQYLQE